MKSRGEGTPRAECPGSLIEEAALAAELVPHSQRLMIVDRKVKPFQRQDEGGVGECRLRLSGGATGVCGADHARVNVYAGAGADPFHPSRVRKIMENTEEPAFGRNLDGI